MTCAALQQNVIVSRHNVGSISVTHFNEEGTHRIRANMSSFICTEFKNGAKLIFSVAEPTTIFLHTLSFTASTAFLKYLVRCISACPYSQEQTTLRVCMKTTSVSGLRCLLVFDVPIM
jgi:hypothetical protein